MNVKKTIITLNSIGLLATAAPASAIVTNQITFTDLQCMKIEGLDVGNKLMVVKSINKSCENLLTFDKSPIESSEIYEDISNIESRVKIEDGNETGVKEGKIERDDLFTCNRIDTQYNSYFKYIPNNIKKNNHTSWGNAKKYLLNVTVPANTKNYKVEVVANVKIKNYLEGGLHDCYSFAQAKLSQLSADPNETLMPYIGIKDENIYRSYCYYFKLGTQNDLFRLFENQSICKDEPYGKGKLSSSITLSNETPEPIEIPIYFWYGFFGGGYAGKENNSLISCSEVTFTANHNEMFEPIEPTSPAVTNQVTFTDLQNAQSLDVGNKLTEVPGKAINKSCENLVAFNLRDSEIPDILKDIYNIESRVKIENGIEIDAKEGKIERDDLFTYDRIDTQYTSYSKYEPNHLIEKNNHTSWGNAKKYQLNVTVPANTKEYEVQVVADAKITNSVNGKGGRDTASFAQAKLSQLSIDSEKKLMPYIGIKDGNIYSYYDENFKIITHNELFRLFDNPTPWERKKYEKAKLSSFITLSNSTSKAKEIPIYFWYGFFGGAYNSKGADSNINCSEVTFSANHIE